MRDDDAIVLKTSAIALDIIKLTNFELGYLAGILKDHNRELAQEFMIALQLNLEE